MAASFGEPLTLSRHDISSKSASSSSPIVASCSTGSKASYATLGVQDEGITIIDLTTLQPDAAALLGLDSAFACAPVSRTIDTEQEEHIRQTYSVASSAKDLSSQSKGGTIVSWSSKESLTSLEKVGSLTLEDPIASLFAPEWMPDAVVAVSPDGITTLCSANLEQRARSLPDSTRKKVLFSFVFDLMDCRFAPSQAGVSKSSLLLMVLKDSRTVSLRKCTVGTDIGEVEEVELPVSKRELISASCDKGGCLSLLADDGTLFSFLIGSQQGTLETTPLDRIQLQNLELSSATTLCLGSTHILVAGVTQGDSDIALLLWDVRYSVLLAQRRVAIPSTLSSIQPKQLALQVVACNDSQSLLIIYPIPSPKRSKSSTTGLKSVVIILPHTIPPASSLANAIGKASAGEAWMKTNHLNDVGADAVDEDRRDILQRVVQALQDGNIDEADSIFFDWLDEQKALAKASAKEEAKRQLNSLQSNGKPMNGTSGKDVSSDSDEGKAKKTDPRVKHVVTQVQFGHVFLTRLLDALFQPTTLQPGKYSPKIPTYLLERKLVSDSMHEGGVLKALHEKNDWESIRWALRNTVDIPEDHLISLLRLTVDLQSMKSADAMEVDENAAKQSAPLALSYVLGHVVAYPTSAPPLRLALRQHFSQAEQVVALLNVLNEWIIAASNQNASFKLGSIEDTAKDEANTSRALSKKGTPRLDMVVNFLSCLLDATLLELLQYRPAYDVLRSISERISPQLSYLDDLEKLRGPLEPFVQADRRGKKDGGSKKQQKRHEVKAQSHALTVDLYEVEDFFV